MGLPDPLQLRWEKLVKGENPTGWVAYVRNFKEKYPDVTLLAADYKILMQKYIKGEPV